MIAGVERIHLIGIGGVGVSGVARLLRSLESRSEEKASFQEAEEGRRRGGTTSCAEHGV